MALVLGVFIQVFSTPTNLFVCIQETILSGQFTFRVFFNILFGIKEWMFKPQSL